MTRLPQRRDAVALLIAATALAACGNEDGDEAGDDSTPTEATATDTAGTTPGGGRSSPTDATVTTTPTTVAATSPTTAATLAPTTVAAQPTTATTVAPSETTAAAPSGVGVALIVDNSADPYIATMVRAAEADAGMLGVSLAVTASELDGDTQTQIAAIDAAIARGDAGILITPSGDEVVPALEMARGAGLYTFALDAAPNPPTAVDITFASDNLAAGQLIGQWAVAQLGDQTARIAMLDLAVDQAIPIDYLRDQGFLMGMGIVDDVDTSGNGKEPETGTTPAVGTTRSSATNQRWVRPMGGGPRWRLVSPPILTSTSCTPSTRRWPRVPPTR